MRVTERLPPVAAALSALATLACCLPLGIAGAVGALGLSVALEALRPWLIGLAVVLLGFSGFQMYRSGKSCRRRSRLSLVLFGLSAAIVLGVMLFPQTLAELMATLR
jgi:hypothetical protein